MFETSAAGPHTRMRSPTAARLTLVAILLLAAALRAYHLTAPYIDLSAWRSVDYAAMARNYLEQGFTFTLPRVDWAGPVGGVETELPLMPYLASLAYAVLGVHDWIGRLLTVILSLIGLAYTYALTRRALGQTTALATTLVLALNPMHLYFSRTFQADVPMMAAATAALYHLDLYLEGRRRHAVATALALTLAAGFKLSALYIGLPMVALVLVRQGWRGLLRPGLWAIAAGGLFPAALWYAHARQLFLTYGYTFGILSGGHDKLQTFTYLSMPYWWRVMLLERAWGWIFTPVAVPLFLLGLWALIGPRSSSLPAAGRAVVLSWLGAGVLFVVVVAEGNFDMPHYQLAVVIPAAMVTGLGLERAAALARSWPGGARAVVAVTAVGLLLGTVWTLRDAYDDKRGREQKLAQALAEVMPDDALLLHAGAYTAHVGGYDYEPMVFYYAHRKGWVLTPEQYTPEAVERFIDQGATWLAAQYVDRLEAYPDFVRYLRDHHQVVEWSSEQVIVRLKRRDEKTSARATKVPAPVPPAHQD